MIQKQPKTQEVWQEVDKRFKRLVRIIGIDRQAGVAIIKTISSDCDYANAKKTTVAKLYRFNGKHSGYKYVRSK